MVAVACGCWLTFYSLAAQGLNGAGLNMAVLERNYVVAKKNGGKLPEDTTINPSASDEGADEESGFEMRVSFRAAVPESAAALANADAGH